MLFECISDLSSLSSSFQTHFLWKYSIILFIFKMRKSYSTGVQPKLFHGTKYFLYYKYCEVHNSISLFFTFLFSHYPLRHALTVVSDYHIQFHFQRMFASFWIVEYHKKFLTNWSVCDCFRYHIFSTHLSKINPTCKKFVKKFKEIVQRHYPKHSIREIWNWQTFRKYEMCLTGFQNWWNSALNGVRSVLGLGWGPRCEQFIE